MLRVVELTGWKTLTPILSQQSNYPGKSILLVEEEDILLFQCIPNGIPDNRKSHVTVVHLYSYPNDALISALYHPIFSRFILGVYILRAPQYEVAYIFTSLSFE